jgi:hypothetical protein
VTALNTEQSVKVSFAVAAIKAAGKAVEELQAAMPKDSGVPMKRQRWIEGEIGRLRGSVYVLRSWQDETDA